MSHEEQQKEFERLMGNVMWAGELKAGPSSYTPPVVPWRTRVYRAVKTWLWSYAPRVHFGPCDHEDCENWY